jgi:hypothetical protein
MSSTLISLCKWFLLSLLTLQIDFACDADGEVENPDVAQVSELFVAVDNSCGLFYQYGFQRKQSPVFTLCCRRILFLAL